MQISLYLEPWRYWGFLYWRIWCTSNFTLISWIWKQNKKKKTGEKIKTSSFCLFIVGNQKIPTYFFDMEELPCIGNVPKCRNVILFSGCSCMLICDLKLPEQHGFSDEEKWKLFVFQYNKELIKFTSFAFHWKIIVAEDGLAKYWRCCLPKIIA